MTRACMRQAWFVVVAAALTVFPAVARAEGRVVVVNGDPVLVKAISRALIPWGLEIIAVTDSAIEPEMRGALAHARETAVRDRAAAVVWTAPTANAGATESLWVYDTATEQIVVRPLSASAPFDLAMAASIALSVKTVLRSTAIAPPDEQVAALAVVPSLTPAPAPATPAPPAASLAEREATPPRAQLQRRFRLEAALGLRVLAGDPSGIEPRAGLAVSFWPASWRARAGIAIGAVGGTGVPIDRASFTGTFTDTALGFGGRLRVPVNLFELELGAGASAHFTAIRGNDAVSGAHVGASRVNPSLDVSAVLSLPLGARVDVGAVVGFSYLLRYQSYFASTIPVFTLSSAEPSASLRFAVTFD